MEKIWLLIEKSLSVRRQITNIKYEGKELHRRFIKAGYKFDHAEGSHYFYIKNGELTEPIPYHGAKEIFQPLANKLIKKYGV